MQRSTRVVLGSDHAGFKLKESVKEYLSELGYKYDDLGVHDEKPSDYPKISYDVASRVARENLLGILMCGTGIGECISANKVRGIRAATCFNEYTAQKSREHNNSNVLCLGARILNEEKAKKIVKVWLESEFSSEPRHLQRVRQIAEIESKTMK